MAYGHTVYSTQDKDESITFVSSIDNCRDIDKCFNLLQHACVIANGLCRLFTF